MSAKKQDDLTHVLNPNTEANENSNTSEAPIDRNLFSIDLDFQPDQSVRVKIQNEIEEQRDRLHRIWAGVGLRK